MTLYHSKFVRGPLRVPTPDVAGDVTAERFTFTVPADLENGDIIELAVLPEWCTVRDAILDVDPIDGSSPLALLLDVGLMSGQVGEDLDDAGNARTSDDEIFDGVNVGQAGGVVRPTLATAFRIVPTAGNRSIGVKVAAVISASVIGEIGLTLFYGAGQQP